MYSEWPPHRRLRIAPRARSLHSATLRHTRGQIHKLIIAIRKRKSHSSNTQGRRLAWFLVPVCADAGDEEARAKIVSCAKSVAVGGQLFVCLLCPSS